MEVIAYFKEIALGFEFGNASEVTRKWTSKMKILVGGNPTTELLNELERIVTEINDLGTDGFSIEIVQDSSQSNYYIFFGSGEDYVDMFPYQAGYINANLGLFSVSSYGTNQLSSGHMYVDIHRANSILQKHLLREELTQSLGLAKDSFKYAESIFQQNSTTTTEYANIDKDLIRLLYHPAMVVGLNENQVHDVLVFILTND